MGHNGTQISTLLPGRLKAVTHVVCPHVYGIHPLFYGLRHLWGKVDTCEKTLHLQSRSESQIPLP